jgi:phage terminase large subunit-like protein
LVFCPHCGAKKAHYCKPLADQNVNWYPEYITHVKGRWAGQPLVLLPWSEHDVIRPVFGRQVFDADLKMWLRQIRTCYAEVPRKNVKSTKGAAVGIKLTTNDGERGAEIYCVAEDTEQAYIIFAMARAMVEANKDLSKICKVYKRLIEVPHTGNIFRVLPGDAAGAHGLSPHGVIFDELHTQANRELWDVMTSGQGARAQPLVIAFSTAGTDKHSICREIHDYGEQVKAGIIEDPSFHYVRYGVPESEPYDWEDEELWKRCNPALGAVITMSFLRAEYRKAKASPGRQNAFRNLYLNDWTEQAIRWMDLGAWDASAGLVDEVQLKGEAAFGGLDASHTQHIASLCWDFGKERLWRFWLPRERLQYLNEETAGAASGWAAQGFLMLTDGDVTDYTAIESKILEDMKTFNVKEVGYNSHSITPMVNNLTDKNVVMVPISQGITTLSDGTKEFERQVLNGTYLHGGNPVMRWMVDGLVVKRDSDQHLKPDKEKSKVNISGVTAGVMALDRRMRHVEEPPQRSRELVTF